MRAKGLLLTLVLIVGLLVVACGGEDDATSADASESGSASSAETTAVENTATSEATEEATVAETEEETPDAANTAAPEATATDESPAATEVDIEHAQGTTTVPLNPETVAVFDYSALDTLDQLGVEIAGVPQGNLPAFLSQYEDSAYANIGTLFEPDYEKLNALDPDLIIVAGRSSAAYGELSKMAPTIDLTIDAADWLSSFKAQTINLATIFGKEDEAAEKLAAIEESIAEVQENAAAQEGRGLIVMVSGGDVTAYGPGSRFGIIHDVLGVPPVDEDIDAATHGDAISFEFIQEMNPDLLYVIDRDSAIGESGAAAQEVLDNDLVHTTAAWSNDAVTYLDSSTWYLANAGLGTVASMVGEIAGSLE